MPTPGQLINGMALALRLPKETITVYDRLLAERGLRTRGGRGKSAAKVSVRDAAILLAAILMSEEIVDADNAARVALWMTVENVEIRNEANPFVQRIKHLCEGNASFIDILAEIIQATADGVDVLTNGTSITAEKGSPYAHIDLMYVRIDFDLAQERPDDIDRIADRFLKSRLQLTATILVDAIIDIASIFASK